MLVLCMGLLPVWQRHLATSRAQSEAAVSQMMQAFSDIGPHIAKAERQSQQINDALSQPVGRGFVSACETLLTPLLGDTGLAPHSRAAIGQVLDIVRQAAGALEAIAKPMQEETHVVAEQVDHMYRGFQYQDRISQMMGLVEDDMARLLDALQSPGSHAPALTQWLAELETRYAMTEQRDDHNGQSPRDAATGSADSETTFF